MKKVSNEDILALCNSKGLHFVDRFVKNENTYLKCICNKHYEPYEFEISYRNLKNLKNNCPKCSGKSMTTEDIRYRIEVQLKLPVSIIGEYTNMKTPIKVQCNKCKRIWDANVVSLCQGSGCSKCNKSGKPLKDHDVFIKELSQVQPNLIVTSQYKGDKKIVSFKCKIDGCKGEALAGNLLTKNTQCRCCVKQYLKESQILSQYEFEKRMEKINPQIKVMSKYNGYDAFVEFNCSIHNKIYRQRACDALQGKCGCTKCVSSKGEKKIAKILDNLNIKYKSQYKFQDCKDINALPFDFFIPYYNIAIEYQGEQHYKPVQFGGISIEEAKKIFEIQKRHDNIKSNYCMLNGIKLLSIPYTEFNNLEKIIKEKCVK